MDRQQELEHALAEAGRAIELTILYFQRADASGRFLGDDEHEAWTALCQASPFRNGRILSGQKEPK